MDDWLSGLGFFGTGLLIAGAVLTLFYKADEYFSDAFKREVANRLKRLDIEQQVRWWPDHFAALFDKLFGNRHLSRRCFSRSCLASLTAVLIWTAIAAATLPRTAMSPAAFMLPANALSPDAYLYAFDAFMAGFKLYGLMDAASSVLFIAIIAGLLNCVPDYISLLETRYLLKLPRSL